MQGDAPARTRAQTERRGHQPHGRTPASAPRGQLQSVRPGGGCRHGQGPGGRGGLRRPALRPDPKGRLLLHEKPALPRPLRVREYALGLPAAGGKRPAPFLQTHGRRHPHRQRLRLRDLRPHPGPESRPLHAPGIGRSPAPGLQRPLRQDWLPLPGDLRRPLYGTGPGGRRHHRPAGVRHLPGRPGAREHGPVRQLRSRAGAGGLSHLERHRQPRQRHRGGR